MIKRDPRYRVTVFTHNETVTIEYPITCKFNVTRSTFSASTECNIQLYNLAPSTRNIIFQDLYSNAIDSSTWKYVHFEAGYGDTLSAIFKGRIKQAYSYKSGGQTDIITEIQVIPFDIFDCQTSVTFEAGTSYKEALSRMASDMPNVIQGNTGALEGTFKTQTTFDGVTFQEINTLTGGHSFVDNGVLNTIMSNEVIDVPVPVISDDSGLLGTPMRRGSQLEVKMLFEPSLIIGQLLEINSRVATQFNGQFKVIGFNHNGTISATQGGQRITTATLWIAPLLPGADINLTNEAVTTGSAAPVNKVKGNNITPVTEKEPTGVREVYNFIQRKGYAPHTNITKNIYWDEVVKPNSLAYSKPSIKELTNLYSTATRIQTFIDTYYPGSKVQINSGWRSRGYNSTLKNADPNSEHLYGNAIDFAVIGQSINTVYANFKRYWKGRKYKHDSYGFIHADITTRRGVYANDW